MEVKDLQISYGTHKVLNGLSFDVKEGKITTIIGANGSGKSTLFNGMTKNLRINKGSILLDGKNIETIPLKCFAKKTAIVHQYNSAPNDLTVEKLVGYGRIAHCGFYGKYNKEDKKTIEWAMEVTDTIELQKKRICDLSGGQQQRVWIAMALAQDTKLLFLDEPTTYLDIRYQIEILRLIKQLNEKYHITILMVLHDINQAVHYSDEIIAMKDGKVIAIGRPKDIITKELIEKVYDISLEIEQFGESKYIITV